MVLNRDCGIKHIKGSKHIKDSTNIVFSRRDFTSLSLLAATLMFTTSPVFAVLNGCAETTEKREIIDMGGRTVMIPKNVNRLLCTNPIGTVDVYMLNPALLVGWNFKPQTADAKFLDNDAMTLPSLGVWMGAGSVPNVEEVLAQAPSVLLCFWSVDDAGVSMANSIAEQTRLPVLLCDCDIRNVAMTYRFLGEVLQDSALHFSTKEERDMQSDAANSATANTTVSATSNAANISARLDVLVEYFTKTLAMIKSTVDSISDAERKSVYLSEGKGGLQTDPVGSLHVQDALDLLKIRNVVQLPGSEGQGMGMPSVSIEQIINWAPDAVLVSEYSMSDSAKSDLYNEILADANWQNVSCVKAGEVYQIPQSPFSWFGRPPSVMRLLGCLWLLEKLYPKQSAAAGIDLKSETRRFFSTCLNYELSESEIKMLLKE
ncbi:MAG: ABC transporter substrate-binding protein [Coriobacteriales bacterium]|jgi:iron complex transport system substrate-binding protein|nr:ABC transporter substrate-binding protein [Coriobacteriales bacterium]